MTCRNCWNLTDTDDVGGVLVGTRGWTEVSLLTLDVRLDVHVILESVVLHQPFQTFIETQVQVDIRLDLDGSTVVSQIFWLISREVDREIISEWRHLELILLHLDDRDGDAHDGRPAEPVVPGVPPGGGQLTVERLLSRLGSSPSSHDLIVVNVGLSTAAVPSQSRSDQSVELPVPVPVHHHPVLPLAVLAAGGGEVVLLGLRPVTIAVLLEPLLPLLLGQDPGGVHPGGHAFLKTRTKCNASFKFRHIFHISSD